MDVLKELCLEHKDGDYIHTALKSKDKFGQTPMLSSISASENRNEILKFLLNLILERSSDTGLQEVKSNSRDGVLIFHLSLRWQFLPKTNTTIPSLPFS